MPLSKEKRPNPTQKHLNSHCYILYKKTFENVVRSLQKKTLSIKKIQPDAIVENLYLEMKIITNPKNDQIQQTKHILKNQFSSKIKKSNQTLKLLKNPDRPRSLSTNKTQKLFFLKQSTQTTSNTRTQTNLKLSTKNSSQNQNQTTLLNTLKEQNNFYKVKCFESQQKLTKLSKKLHEQKKIHQAEKNIYEKQIHKLKHLIQNSKKEKQSIYQQINSRNNTQERIPFKVLAQQEENGLGCCNQQDEVCIDLQLQSNIIKRNSNKVAC